MSLDLARGMREVVDDDNVRPPRDDDPDQIPPGLGGTPAREVPAGSEPTALKQQSRPVLSQQAVLPAIAGGAPGWNDEQVLVAAGRETKCRLGQGDLRSASQVLTIMDVQ